MPQPMSSHKVFHFDFTAAAPLRRPKLAAYVTTISNFWNETEARIALFLAALLGPEASTVVTIFLTIQSDSAKRSVIDSVARLKLPADQQQIFTDALTKLGKRYKERNDAIHGGWGYSNDYPDALLWSDIRATNALAVELMHLGTKGDAASQYQKMREHQRNILIYKEIDFIDIYNRMVADFNELDAFVGPFISRSFGGNFAATSKVPMPRV